MRFVRLSLRNICQIETLDWEFGDGLIGVYGPNGSGKSNAMLVATHVALTGTYSRHPQGKAGVLMDGAQEGSIELVVRCNDTDVNIRLDLTRTLKDPKIKFLLRYHDGNALQVISDHGPVYACLSEKFGVDAAMLSDYVLVSQTSLCDMVSQLPSDRVKALGRLCGTDHSEAVWKALTNRATLLRSTLASVAVIQDDTAELLRQAGKRLREHKQHYASLRDAVPSKKERTALRNVIDNRVAWQAARKDKEELDAEQLRLTKEASSLTTKQAQCEKQRRAAAKQYKQAKRQALQARQALQQHNAAVKARRTYVSLRRDITAAETTMALPDVPVPKSRWADAGKRQTQLQRELYRAEQRLSVDGRDACPTCGTSVTAMQADIDKARKAMPVIKQELEELSEYFSAVDAAEVAQARVVAEREAAVQTVKRLRTSLEALPRAARRGQKLPKDVATLKSDWAACRQEYRKTKAALRDAVKAVKVATSAKDAAVASLKAITLRVLQAEKRLESLTKVTSSESRIARERLTAIAAQRRDAVVARRAYDEQRGLYRQAKEAHARDVDNRTRKQKMRDWADRLDKLQQYMHRNGLPKSVHNEALSLLEERINPTLASLGAAFRVTVDEEDASLVAVMPNGRNTPAQALSGGQQVSVAWSYRLTVKETFASHFDTLVLDEPTQWLDDQRMDCLVEVLNHVRRRARKLGQQIIIVSHSERLRRVFDKILKVPDAGAS